jgi:hypothetical protein
MKITLNELRTLIREVINEFHSTLGSDSLPLGCGEEPEDDKEVLNDDEEHVRCNCENGACDHEPGDCKNPAASGPWCEYVGKICGPCATNMPSEYLSDKPIHTGKI